MSTRFETYKIIMGSAANQHVIEDPIKGSNGTAVITRMNNFIDVVGETFDDFLPSIKGALSTVNTNNKAQDIVPGPNGYCLVSDTSSDIGLSFQERVNLSSNQNIGGIKTFLAQSFFKEGGISDKVFEFKDDINVKDTTSTNKLVVNDSTILKGSTVQHGNFTSKSLSIFEMDTNFMANVNVQKNAYIGGDLEVSGRGSYGKDVDISGSLDVNSSLNIGSTVKVNGTITGNQDLYIKRNTSLDGNTNVGGDINIRGSITVVGNSNISGFIEGNSYIKANVLNINTNAIIGTKLDIGTDINVVGKGFIGGDLIVNGTSNLNNIKLMGSLLVNQTFQVSKVSTFKDVINGSSINLSEGINSLGNSKLGDIEVSNILDKGNLSVLGTSNLKDIETENVIVNGDVYISKDIRVVGSGEIGSILVKNGGKVSGNLEVSGLITGGSISGKSGVINEGLLVKGSASINNIETKGSFISYSLNSIFNGNVEVKGNIKASNVTGINTGDEVIATPSVSGTVRITNSKDINPMVYTKEDADSTFINKEDLGVSIPILENGKIDISMIPDSVGVQIYEASFDISDVVEGLMIVNHGLNKRYISSITIWNNQGEKVYPSLIKAISNNEISIDFTGLPVEGTWYVSITK